jgi:hypothetical protein
MSPVYRLTSTDKWLLAILVLSAIVIMIAG